MIFNLFKKPIYEVALVSSIDYLMNEKVIAAQKQGWEFNGGMVIT